MAIERHKAELSAGERLLQSTMVRVGAIVELLIPTLQWIAKKFAEGAIGQLAGELLKLIARLIAG